MFGFRNKNNFSIRNSLFCATVLALFHTPFPSAEPRSTQAMYADNTGQKHLRLSIAQQSSQLSTRGSHVPGCRSQMEADSIRRVVRVQNGNFEQNVCVLKQQASIRS